MTPPTAHQLVSPVHPDSTRAPADLPPDPPADGAPAHADDAQVPDDRRAAGPPPHPDDAQVLGDSLAEGSPMHADPLTDPPADGPASPADPPAEGPPPHPDDAPVPADRPAGLLADGSSPELPPEAFAAVLAGLPGMGPARLTAVLTAATPAEAWARVAAGRPWTQPAVVRALGARGSDVLARWRDAARDVDPATAWQALVASDVEVTLHGRPGYPDALVGDVEPPAVLFHRGDLAVISGPRVAIVGTRRCSSVGIAVAFELGRDLAAAGVVVVSGLAAGVDAAAHRGVMAAAAAPPVGVVGSGLDVVYPRGQSALWRSVGRAGVLLSEAPLGARPERWRFPARNRIIAACSDLVVVVESHRRGGSLHTVDEADRRGIDVMAVPGSVRSPAAAGTNDLLAEGRAPVCSAADVLVALGLRAGGRGDDAGDRRPPPDPADELVLDLVGWQPASLDQLVLRSGTDLATLAPALDRLCEAGWVARRGGWYERIAGGQGDA